MTYRVLVIPGDGIGAEIMPHVLRVLDALGLAFAFDTADLGGNAIDKHGTPLPPDTLAAARTADAVLLGAVGGPQWDDLPMDQRPEKGLLGCAPAWTCSPICARRCCSNRWSRRPR